MTMMAGKKIIVLFSMLVFSIGLTACNQGRDNSGNEVQLPKGAKGAFSFNGAGKGVKLLNKAGKPISPTKLDLSDAKLLGEVTIRRYKKNPCVIEWCPDTGVCEVYIYEEMETCPNWW